MTQSTGRSVEQVVQELESRIRRNSVAGVLGRHTVEALDVVGHALTFTRHPQALELWREALWNRQLVPEAREAVRGMLEYMKEAVRAGRNEEISRICDCLQVVVHGAGSRDPHDRERHDAR